MPVVQNLIQAWGSFGELIASTVSSGGSAPPTSSLLRHENVTMTVFAQDPGGPNPLLARITVPADRLARGPRNHRFHVVDITVGSNYAQEPAVLHVPDEPWDYVDRWAAVGEDGEPYGVDALVEDPEFRAQSVFAVAAHTLAVFESHLGRPIPWASGYHQLFLVPTAKVQANAAYTPGYAGVQFGWLPKVERDGRPTLPAVYTCLSFDIVAHEVSHAVLDGLRPMYAEPGLPDQAAFHEALADLVAMLSVFDNQQVVERLLKPGSNGRVDLDKRKLPNGKIEHGPGDTDRPARATFRAERLQEGPLLAMAEQLGGRLTAAHGSDDRGRPGLARLDSLRRSVQLHPDVDWDTRPEFREAHRRAEVLVAIFLQTFVGIWGTRLDPLDAKRGLDVARVAEEGRKAAQHLLAMLLRALDYLPPIELEFEDVLDAVLVADQRMVPDDPYDYRGKLERSFRAFGITIPPMERRIVDEDGTPERERTASGRFSNVEGMSFGADKVKDYATDPDARTRQKGLRYEHLNLAALRTSAEEVFQFMWNNQQLLHLDLRLATRVERVISSTRIGVDGLVVVETLADYLQTVETTLADYLEHAGPKALGDVDLTDVPDDTPIQLRGGGVLVFDQFGRFRLHQRKLIFDFERQSRRLAHLIEQGIKSERRQGYGFTDGVNDTDRFALLHRGTSEDQW